MKGPSAATLYGTNAANGVVVITTKKGRAGATHWNWTAETRTIDDRTHTRRSTRTSVTRRRIRAKRSAASLPSMVDGAVLHRAGRVLHLRQPDALQSVQDPSNTFIDLGRGSLFGVNVSGGNDAVRFFVSGDVDNEFGPIQMPAPDIRVFPGLAAPNCHVRRCSTRAVSSELNFRTNLSASLSPKFDLTANAGFGKSDNSIEPDNSLLISLLYLGQANYGYKGCPKGTENTGAVSTSRSPIRPASRFTTTTRSRPAPSCSSRTPVDVQRTTGSLDANWRPLHLDAERRHGRCRPRDQRRVPRLPAERVSATPAPRRVSVTCRTTSRTSATSRRRSRARRPGRPPAG